MNWIRARACGSHGSCVEVQPDEDEMGVQVRSSTDPESGYWFDADEWDVFIAAVKAGDFDSTVGNWRTP